jgi:hypothetical protein
VIEKIVSLKASHRGLQGGWKGNMRKLRALLICIGILAGLASLYAHSPALPLGAGKIGLSWYWRLGTGINIGNLLSFNELDQLTEIDILPLTPEYNFAYGGTLMLFEYGITDFWSVGIQANLFDFVRYGLQYQHWKLYPSIYTDFNIVNLPYYTLNASAEFQVSPLISIPKGNWMGDGVFNLFLTASNNFGFIRSDSFDLFGYSDLKLITTWVNQAYDADCFKTGIEYYDLSMISVSPDGVSFEIGVMSKIAVALGLEMRWRRFWFNLGFNFEILEFSLTHRLYSILLEDLSTFFWGNVAISNIEFSWRWRL